MTRRTVLASLLFVLPLCASAYEAAAHFLRVRAVPSPEDWRRAAEAIRREKAPSDLVVAAPQWIRQTAYMHLGDDLVPLKDAARADTSTYARLWVVSIRGAEAPEARGIRPDVDLSFGGVRVRRHRLPRPARVAYDFVEHVEEAGVSLVGRSETKECPWQPPGRRHRLGRFQCNPRVSWSWVGERIMDDLSHAPRRGIWAHPVRGRKLVVEFADVPLASELRGYTGLGYEAARLSGPQPPVRLDVFVDDERVGRAVHRQMDGWKPWRVDTARRRGERVRVRFEVSARRTGMRHFYFVADTRDP